MIGILGEALIDLIGGTDCDGTDCFRPYAGGCALNAAIAASRLGERVMYIGKISQDAFGKHIASYLQDNGVILQNNLCDAPEHTMLGFAQLDSAGAASYAFYTTGTTIEALTAEDIIDAVDSHPEINMLHVGSVSLLMDASGETIVGAMRAWKSNPMVFFDPNIRLSVIQDEVGCRKRIMETAERATIVKLSHEDLAWMFEGETVKEGIDALLACGTKHVLLTRGPDGLDWVSASGSCIHEDAVDVSVVDTVGAGDTVSGAILAYASKHGLCNAEDFTEPHIHRALEFASLCASVTCSRKGCNPPRLSEIK